MIILFFIHVVILISIPISIEIQFQCPGPQQWNMRAISRCQSKLDYVCLWNSFKLAFNEACVGPWEESGGRRTVLNLNGKQDAENCPWEYYQPENINFRTSQGDNCLYQKSLCSEVGQLIHSNGSTTADRTCRCDYTMGYAFISTTRKNPCYCVVSEEDCACYSKECDEDKILSPDYQCIRREENQTQFNCSEVHVIQKDSAIVSRSSDTEQMLVRWNYVAAGIVTALSNVIFIMIIVCWKFEQIRYGCCQKTFIKKHPVPMEKRQKEQNMSVKLLKDGSEISKSNDKPFIKKHLVPMVIMEGLDVTLECEIEKEQKEQNLSIKWFKDGSEISKSDDKCFQSELGGRVFMLKIDPAEPDHKGKYKIMFMNKYESEAYLDVNPMPTEIKDLPKESRDAFLKAAKEGTTKRYFLRIIIVGKEKSGKTCLLRRLMNQEINDVKSTNCLDVASCQISLLDGKWEFLDIKKDITQWDKLADCGLWDFAGQREYYATHQIFLTPNAIYILTVDISEDLSTLTNMEMQEKAFACVGDYINFWIDNIHCYAKQNMRTEHEETNGLIFPAVILVGTGIDKYQKEEEIKDREEKLNTCITNLLGKQLKRKHLWKVRTLSNTEPSEKKTEFEDLRNIIYEIAKTLPKWGEHLPISWILLEKAIQQAQDTTKIMAFTDVLNLAKNCKFRNEHELLSFLNYEHNVGNIIFFDTIKENIVLDPMWLVLALRCLVAPEEFRKDFAGNLDWAELIETGLLSDRLINLLFQTQNDPLLIEQKHYVMRIMEAFNIVIKLHDGKYYLPSLIKPTTFEDIITKFNVAECKMFSWLCLDFTFLPPSFFNHILVGFISKKYKLSHECEDKPALYQGIGVFSLTSESGPDSKYLVVCVFRNIVALQVWQRETKVMCNSKIRKDLIEIISNIQRRYRIDIKYKIQLLCSSRSYYKSNKRKDIFELIQCYKFYCWEHGEFHQSDHLCCVWYTTLSEHAEANLYKTDGCDSTYRHACHECEKKPSVYWCPDCQKSMCKDCNHHHRESGGAERHVVQHVQDTYSLDYKVKVNVGVITDIKMLNDGLLVIADLLGQQLVTCDISGQQQQHTIPLPGEPLWIAVVDNNTVAVTLRVVLEQIVIVNIEQRQVIQRITVKGRCRGIMYRDNQLFVGCRDKTIKVMNMSGEVTRTIPVSVLPNYICGGVEGRIFYTDRDKLYCSDTVGKTLFTFSNRDMSDPVAITTDDDDHVLVICKESKNVLGISPDGKQSQIIIKQIPLVNLPYMYYDSLSKALVIGSGDNIYVYNKI